MIIRLNSKKFWYTRLCIPSTHHHHPLACALNVSRVLRQITANFKRLMTTALAWWRWREHLHSLLRKESQTTLALTWAIFFIITIIFQLFFVVYKNGFLSVGHRNSSNSFVQYLILLLSGVSIELKYELAARAWPSWLKWKQSFDMYLYSVTPCASLGMSVLSRKGWKFTSKSLRSWNSGSFVISSTCLFHLGKDRNSSHCPYRVKYFHLTF